MVETCVVELNSAAPVFEGQWVRRAVELGSCGVVRIVRARSLTSRFIVSFSSFCVRFRIREHAASCEFRHSGRQPSECVDSRRRSYIRKSGFLTRWQRAAFACSFGSLRYKSVEDERRCGVSGEIDIAS